MPTVLDLIFLVFLAAIVPAYDYWVDWPHYLRALDRDPNGARVPWYRRVMLQQWVLTAVAVGLWRYQGRAWSDLGFRPVGGLRLWLVACGLLLLGATYRSSARRLSARPQSSALLRAKTANVAPIVPRTREELAWSVPLSLTAGVCEETLYRGYFLVVLAPVFGWWGGALLSSVPFGLAHAYQGRSGIVRTAVVGVFLASTVALTGSIWPAMALHALIDVGGMQVMSVCYRAEALAA